MSDNVSIDDAAALWNRLKNHTEVVLVACKKDGEALKFASDRLKNHKEVVLVACKKDGGALQYASDGMKNCKKVALLACNQEGCALEFASNKMKNTKEVVLVACKQDGEALQFASNKMKNTKEVVLVACTDHGWALEFASNKMKNTKEVVLVACRRAGLALQFASARLKNTEEIVLVAVKHNGTALGSASADMKNRVDVVAAALNEPNHEVQSHVAYHSRRRRRILGYASPEIKEKIAAFEAMVNADDGILRSLNKADPFALSTHLEEKFRLRRIFQEPVCSGISPRSAVGRKRARDGGGPAIPFALVKNIAGYAGMPTGEELRQLRLVQDILPIAMAKAAGSGTSWATLRLRAQP